MMTPSHLQP